MPKKKNKVYAFSAPEAVGSKVEREARRVHGKRGFSKYVRLALSDKLKEGK